MEEERNIRDKERKNDHGGEKGGGKRMKRRKEWSRCVKRKYRGKGKYKRSKLSYEDDQREEI